MVNDTLSDVLTRIRNGCLNNSQVVSIPLTRLSQQICHTLEKEGFIESFQRDTSLGDLLIVKLKYKDSALGFAGTRDSFSQAQDGAKENKTKSRSFFEKSKEGLKNNNQIDNSIKNSFADGGQRHQEAFVKRSLATPYEQTLSKKRPCITNLKRISKPGLRIYARHKQIPTVLGGLGILILSTPKGIMTDREARFRKVGGEILCSVW